MASPTDQLSLPTVPEAPVIDTQRTFAYDQIFLCWRLPPHSPPAWHYTIEFRRTDVPAQPGPTHWQRREEVRGTSALLENPDTGSVYVLRVRGCNKAGYGEYSEDVHLHTPPAPGEWAEGWAQSGTDPAQGMLGPRPWPGALGEHRRDGVMQWVTLTNAGARLAGFKSPLCLLPAVWLRASHSPSEHQVPPL